MEKKAENNTVKVALLSNVNMDFTARLLPPRYEVYPTVGYGDVWGVQLDEQGPLAAFAPEVVVLLTDADRLFRDCNDLDEARDIVDRWFDLLVHNNDPAREYLVSDLLFCQPTVSDLDDLETDLIAGWWLACLGAAVVQLPNVHRFPLAELLSRQGTRKLLSPMAWYLGKVPYTVEGCKLLAAAVDDAVQLLRRVPKKVLVLDLDDTLWGGVLGEVGENGITLSDDGVGAAYRDAQRLVAAMKNHGVLLALASKNNVSDVDLVWQNNPQMVLKKEDFAAARINWQDKVENLQSMAQELNLGLDSFVFVDDSPAERENVAARLPMVTVPEFPAKKEELPGFFAALYRDYFKKARATRADAEKTEQYHQNARRAKLGGTMAYDDFLRTLQIKAERVENTPETLARAVQLLGKTNQFNVTTNRYTLAQLEEKLAAGWALYAYRVADKFGDFGIVAVLLVDVAQSRIDTFAMSCRVMGKRLENYFVNEVERDAAAGGAAVLHAAYRPTAKNAPVKALFDTLGYRAAPGPDGEVLYEIDLANRPARQFAVNEKN